MPGTTGEASRMSVVLGIRPPKLAYIDKSNGSSCLGAGGGGQCMYFIANSFVLTYHLFSKKFKILYKLFICIKIYGIHKFACL